MEQLLERHLDKLAAYFDQLVARSETCKAGLKIVEAPKPDIYKLPQIVENDYPRAA